jgi:LPXTG-motif cell wall-anchored protein
MKKFKALAVAGAATALLAGAVFVPSAASADPTISFSASTVCPGESVTFTVNGVSDGTEVTLDAPQVFVLTFAGTSLPASNTAYTGSYTYDQLTTKAGGNDGDYVVKIDDTGDIVAEATLKVLPVCPPPALPNTGIDSVAMAAAGGFAAVATLAGLTIVAVRRRKA